MISALVLLLLVAASVDAFSVSSLSSKKALGVVGASSRSTAARGVVLGSTPKNDDDFPIEELGEEYTGDVDWDAEWKKVVAKEISTGSVSSERPGKDFYKSDAKIAAIRAANKAQTEVQKISSKMPAAPSMNMSSLTGDWRVSL